MSVSRRGAVSDVQPSEIAGPCDRVTCGGRRSRDLRRDRPSSKSSHIVTNSRPHPTAPVCTLDTSILRRWRRRQVDDTVSGIGDTLRQLFSLEPFLHGRRRRPPLALIIQKAAAPIMRSSLLSSTATARQRSSHRRGDSRPSVTLIGTNSICPRSKKPVATRRTSP